MLDCEFEGRCSFVYDFPHPLSRSYQHNPWFVHLVYRLLTHAPDVVSLLDSEYAFKNSPPKYIRATLYHYHYSEDDSGGGDGGDDGTAGEEKSLYWRREKRNSYFPIVDAEDPGLVNYLKSAGIISPSPSTSSSAYESWLMKTLRGLRKILAPVGGFQLCAFLLILAIVGRWKCGK